MQTLTRGYLQGQIAPSFQLKRKWGRQGYRNRIFLVAYLFISLIWTGRVESTVTPTVRILPQINYTSRINATFSISLQIEDVNDLMGDRLKLLFDPTKLRVIQTTEGAFLGTGSPGVNTLFFPQIDNSVGWVEINTARLVSPPATPGVSGSGRLANITFEAIATDTTSSVSFETTDLRNSSGQVIPVVATYSSQVESLLLSSISISPTLATLAVGSICTFTACGYDLYGNPIPGLSFNWQATIGSLTVLSGTQATLFAGAIPGQGSLTLNCGSITAIAAITVTPGDLSRITITPPSLTLVVGASQTFTAYGYDLYDNPIPGLSFNWQTTIGSLTVLSGTQATLFAGVISGQGNLILNCGSITAIAAITVTYNQLHHFALETVANQISNQPFLLTITAMDAYGNVADYYKYQVNLSDTTNSISPRVTSNFKQGIWQGTVTITKPSTGVQIRVSDIVEGISNPFIVLADKTKDEVIKEEGIMIHIPPLSLADDYYIKVTRRPISTEINRANLSIKEDKNIAQIEDLRYQIDIRNKDDRSLTQTSGLQLIIPYQDSQPYDGIVDFTSQPINASSLSIYQLVNNQWIKVTDCQVDTINRQVVGSITQPGTYTVMGSIIADDMSNIVVYPNPFRAFQSKEITFDGLPTGSVIKIYNLAGDLIREIEWPESSWDVKDSFGRVVESQVYLYVITNNIGMKKRGKIAILR